MSHTIRGGCPNQDGAMRRHNSEDLNRVLTWMDGVYLKVKALDGKSRASEAIPDMATYQERTVTV